MNSMQTMNDTQFAPTPLIDLAGISILEEVEDMTETPTVRVQVGADRFHKTLIQLKRLFKVNSYMVALQYVLVRTSGGSHMTLTRTDLDVTATLSVQLDEPAPAGVALLPVQDLDRALKLVGKDQGLVLDLAADREFVNMDDGDSLHQIPAMDPGEFPPLQHAETSVPGMETEKRELGRCLGQVLPFVCTETHKSDALQSLLLEWGGGGAARMVGTDGFRLAVRTMPTAVCPDMDEVANYLLPHRPLTVIQKMLQQEREEGALYIQPLGEAEGGAPCGARMTLAWQASPHLPWRDVQVTVGRLNGKYPSYRQIEPGADYTTTLVLRRDTLAQAAAKAAAYVDSSSRLQSGITLTWGAPAGALVVEGRNRDTKAAVSTTLRCTQTGAHTEGTYCLNGTYLRESLGVVDGDNVCLTLTENEDYRTQPVGLRDVEDADLSIVMMPCS